MVAATPLCSTAGSCAAGKDMTVIQERYAWFLENVFQRGGLCGKNSRGEIFCINHREPLILPVIGKIKIIK